MFSSITKCDSYYKVRRKSLIKPFISKKFYSTIINIDKLPINLQLIFKQTLKCVKYAGFNIFNIPLIYHTI